MGNNETARQKQYQQRVNEKMPRRNIALQCLRAFVSGGIICCIGQAVRDFGEKSLALQGDDVAAFTSIVMVFLGATLTGLGVYDQIGAWAGAGSIVPITGFANSIVSPAMEFKRVGAKLFSIAGPVLVYGISASILVGLLTCLLA